MPRARGCTARVIASIAIQAHLENPPSLSTMAKLVGAIAGFQSALEASHPDASSLEPIESVLHAIDGAAACALAIAVSAVVADPKSAASSFAEFRAVNGALAAFSKSIAYRSMLGTLIGKESKVAVAPETLRHDSSDVKQTWGWANDAYESAIRP